MYYSAPNNPKRSNSSDGLDFISAIESGVHQDPTRLAKDSSVGDLKNLTLLSLNILAILSRSLTINQLIHSFPPFSRGNWSFFWMQSMVDLMKTQSNLVTES
jgi:hypothetical protein